MNCKPQKVFNNSNNNISKKTSAILSLCLISYVVPYSQTVQAKSLKQELFYINKEENTK